MRADDLPKAARRSRMSTMQRRKLHLLALIVTSTMYLGCDPADDGRNARRDKLGFRGGIGVVQVYSFDEQRLRVVGDSPLPSRSDLISAIASNQSHTFLAVSNYGAGPPTSLYRVVDSSLAGSDISLNYESMPLPSRLSSRYIRDILLIENKLIVLVTKNAMFISEIDDAGIGGDSWNMYAISDASLEFAWSPIDGKDGDGWLIFDIDDALRGNAFKVDTAGAASSILLLDVDSRICRVGKDLETGAAAGLICTNRAGDVSRLVARVQNRGADAGSGESANIVTLAEDRPLITSVSPRVQSANAFRIVSIRDDWYCVTGIDYPGVTILMGDHQVVVENKGGYVIDFGALH